MLMSEQITILSSKSLLGTKVVNAQGESLGRLEEVMLDMDTGVVAYVVLSFSKLLGLKDKYFAIPYQALTIDRDSDQIVMNIKKEKLEFAPGFEKSDWPNKANLHWLNRVHNHYGYSSTI
jgi:sporulation protein YlmC with PRC-barrel domain